MKDVETTITAALKNDSESNFSISDEALFKRATTTVNNQQATKDLLALGMASIWIVFVSLFMKILKPIFTQVTIAPKTISTHITNNENK